MRRLCRDWFSIVDCANWFRDLTEDNQRFMLRMMRLHKDGNMFGMHDWWIDGEKLFLNPDKFVGCEEKATLCRFINLLLEQHLQKYYNLDDFEVS